MAAISHDPITPSSGISFEQAVEILSREERFMATVQAMNALLIQKGVYKIEEFQQLFTDWAVVQLGRPATDRPGWKS